MRRYLPAFQQMTLSPNYRCSRNHHSLTFQIPSARTDIYRSSFFLQAIRDWNVLPDSIIVAAEGAEDGVVKFSALVRARDLFTISH